MNKSKLGVLVLLFSLFVGGCATSQNMAFYDESYRITEESNSIVLMTANLKNSLVESHIPALIVVTLEEENSEGGVERLTFRLDEKSRNESKDPEVGNNYLLSMELAAGVYQIKGLTSMSSSFPFRGLFVVPIHEEITVGEQGVFYLGHIEADVRERAPGEFRAGPLFPLLDQSVAGASGGTFEVEITDNWEVDGPLFREEYSALMGIDVVKSVLPPFDRERAQRLWEDPDGEM